MKPITINSQKTYKNTITINGGGGGYSASHLLTSGIVAICSNVNTTRIITFSRILHSANWYT